MKKITGIFALVAAQSLFAGEDKTEKTFKVKAQVRLDHQFSQSKTGDVTTTAAGFKLDRARLVFDGNYNKDVSYRFKLNLDKTPKSSSNSSDGIGSTLKEAKVTYAFAEGLAFEFGRHEVNTMSVEGFYSSMDLYSVSEQLIKRKPESANGVAFVADVAGQNFVLQAVNSPGYETTAAGAAEKSYSVEDDDMTFTLQWRGNIGLLQPHVTAANISRHDYNSTTKVKSERYVAQMYGVGATLPIEDLTFELEGDKYSNPDYKKNKDVDTKSGQASVTTWIASVRYVAQPIRTTAIFKTSQDNEVFGDDKDKDSIQTGKYNVAFEFRPLADNKNLRFHASYERALSNTKKEGKDDVKKTTNTYLVGAAASI